MSDARAIAAVTSTLRRLLERGVQLDGDLNDTTVTILPLDRARDNAANANQLNLFLYQATPSAAWRNQDMPGQTRPGESAFPPLALNLHYLVTVFGKDNDTTMPFSHLLLGRAMSVLHDHPLLGADEIRSAFGNSDLSSQLERVRINLMPLSIEEIFKLWSGFQTPYRLSASYEVAVVLIDSARRARTPLPVLTRGKDDSGVKAQGDLIPPFPAIDRIEAPLGQPSAMLGDRLVLSGHHLDGEKLEVFFKHPLLAAALPVDPLAGATSEQVVVQLPADAAAWPAGPYGVIVVITDRPGRKTEVSRSTNEAAFTLAPELLGMPVKATRANGRATLKVKCRPEVLPAQRVSLLLAGREVPAEPRNTRTDALTFVVENAVAGEFLVRLRVQGADSLLVDRSPMPDKPPVFKEHRVVVK